MSKTITRRAAVTGLAAAPAALAATQVPTFASGAAEQDPIFAAIEAHRDADKAYSDAVDILFRLEEQLPEEKRKTHLSSWNPNVVESDAPEWIEAERKLRAAGRSETHAAETLLDVRPTTFAGVIALLDYTHEYTAWPDGDWGAQVCQHVAVALRTILAKGGEA